jgi:hypothetical protein
VPSVSLLKWIPLSAFGTAARIAGSTHCLHTCAAANSYGRQASRAVRAEDAAQYQVQYCVGRGAHAHILTRGWGIGMGIRLKPRKEQALYI